LLPGRADRRIHCGARALDFRPYLNGKDLVFHHGAIKFNTPVKDALKDVVKWADEHPGDLVLLMAGHCSGTCFI